MKESQKVQNIFGKKFAIWLLLSFVCLSLGCGSSEESINAQDAGRSSSSTKLQTGVGDYPNASLLVSARALQDTIENTQNRALSDDNVVIIDARGSGYDKEHIPGAIHLTWPEFGFPNLNSVKEMEQLLTDRGIARDMTIVVYDDTTASWGSAGRIFWTLEYLGCKDVHLLYGGWDLWLAQNRPVEAAENKLPATTPFLADVTDSILATKEHIRDRRADNDFVVVDSRTDEEYNGWVLYGEKRGGHMSGAVQVPYASFFNEDKTIRDLDTLRKMFDSRAITADKEVTSYCTAGIRSGFVYFLLRLLGYQRCSNYDGSMWDWAAASVDAPETYPMEELQNFNKLVPAKWVNDVLVNPDPASPLYEKVTRYVIAEVAWGPLPSDKSFQGIPGAVHVNTDEIEYDQFQARNSTPAKELERSTTAEQDSAKGLSGDDTLPKNYWNLYPDQYLLPAIAHMGINKDTTVVVYGKNLSGAVRFAWTLMYAGVNDVRLLNGGLKAWTDAGYKTGPVSAQRTPVAYFGSDVAMNPSYRASIEYIRNVVADKDSVAPQGVIADIRTWDEYRGASRPYSYIPADGRIAGAIYGGLGASSKSMEGLVDDDGTLRNYSAVEAMWKQSGITRDKSVSFYCGTGWRSSVAFFMGYLMGWDHISNFDGSWYEWTQGPGGGTSLNPVDS